MCYGWWFLGCNRCTATMRIRTWAGRCGRRARGAIGRPCRRILFRELTMTTDMFYRSTELNRANWPELRDQILHFEYEQAHEPPRSYPGYPRWPLDRVRARLWPPLDRVLRSRRSVSTLPTELPSR